MGWTVDPVGFGVVLSPALPRFLEEHLAAPAKNFTAALGLNGTKPQPICHIGSTKVLAAMETALGSELRNARQRTCGVARPRQHVVAQRVVRAGACARKRTDGTGGAFRAWPRLHRELCRRGTWPCLRAPGCWRSSPRSGFANLCWRDAIRRRCWRAAVSKYGAGHYPLIVALHAAWLHGLWAAGLRPSRRSGLAGAVRRAAGRARLGHRQSRRALDHADHRDARR